MSLKEVLSGLWISLKEVLSGLRAGPRIIDRGGRALLERIWDSNCGMPVFFSIKLDKFGTLGVCTVLPKSLFTVLPKSILCPRILKFLLLDSLRSRPTFIIGFVGF